MINRENPILNKLKKMNTEEKRKVTLRIERAVVSNMKKYKGCCRCVVDALQKNLGLDDSYVIKAAIPLGAGVARSGETCGALIGGLMIIGMVYGPDQLDEWTSPAYTKTMEESLKLYDRFRNKFGTTTCYNLQNVVFSRSFNLKTIDERKQLFEANNNAGFPVIKAAVRMTARQILNDQA
jgi:C_GCAxxG_C_C family probable redox protein